MNKNNSQSNSSEQSGLSSRTALFSYDKWTHRFMDVAYTVASWSSCLRRHVGAVIVRENRILTTGYNGAPAGITSCASKNVCIRDENSIPSSQQAQICFAVHAEQNAILQAARLGISLEGATLYCTHRPCSLCMKCIINAGIKHVIYHKDYNDTFVDKLLHYAESEDLITIERLENYENS